MSFRALLAVLVVAFVACDDSVSMNSDEADAGRGPVLTFEPNAALSLLPRDEAELAVKVEDASGAALPGVEVSFAIEGYAPGASLGRLRPSSDAFGYARTKLRVGSEGSKFEVRATAARAESARLAVNVAKVAVHEILVNLSYEGVRTLEKRTVSARPNITCDKALQDNSAGEINQTISGLRTSVTFQLDPGISYAIVAWGRDETGGLLARGCAETVPPLAQKDDGVLESVTIVLADHEMSLKGPYSVELELNVEASSKRLAKAALEAARAELPNTAVQNADFLLDGIDAELRSTGKNNDASILANKRTSDPSFAAGLDAQLKARLVGPSALIQSFSGFFGTRSPRLLFDGDYRVQGTSMSFVATALYAREGDGGTPLALPKTLAESAVPSLDAAYDQASAKIRVRELSLALPLSTYGYAVYDALDATTTTGLVGTYRETMGCAVLETWASAQPELVSACDATCIAKVCAALEAHLLKVSRAAFGAFSAHTKISLSGDIAVSDRDADQLVDSLGATTLTGAWSIGTSVSGADEVKGKLSAAQPDVLK